MKVRSIATNSIYPKSDIGKSPVPRERKIAHEHRREERENLNQINTTIRNNSDGRVSFKGGVPFLHSAANFASNNPLVAEALFAILVTCGLRPITIMATAKNSEDKEKCSYQAAKSISSGVVGLAMTALVGTPLAAATKLSNSKGAFNMPPELKEQSQNVVNKGIEALKKLAEKLTQEGKDVQLVKQIEKLTDGGKINLGIFAHKGKDAQKLFTQEISEKAPEIIETVTDALKEQKVLNNFARTGKNVMDKLFQPVFMPLRAMVTIALVPVILKAFGLSKPGKKQQEKPEQNPQLMLNYEVFQTNNEKELFQSFSEVISHEN